MKKNDMTEIQKTDQAQAAAKIFMRKQVMELLAVMLPWLVFVTDFGVTIYTVINADTMKIIATGVLYAFSLLFLFLMRRG